MSSDQQDKSIAAQREEVSAIAAENGYAIVREYVDEAISGWRDDRKAFQRLITDAQAGQFQAVLCWDQDRFSRFDVLEANHYWFLLDRAGVHIFTANQGRLDFSQLAGWLTASINQHAKAQYCRDLAKNTTRGLRRRKLAGEWVGSPPLGYAIGSDNHLVIGDHRDVETVRTIFRLRASGAGHLAIAKHLNSQGIPTPRGRKWRQFTVQHILHREAYLGHCVIGKHSRAKYERLTADVVTIRDAHPALIDQELWDACRRVDQQLHRSHTRNGSEGAQLGGLLFCGCCGSVMYPVSQGKWRYYVCGAYHCHGQCGRCALPQDHANHLILTKVRDALHLDDLPELERIIAKKLRDRDRPVIDRSNLEKQIAAIDRKIANAAERLITVDKSLVRSVEAKMLELQRERDALVSRLDGEKPARRVTASEVLQSLCDFDRLLTGGRPSVIRTALSRIIRRVDVAFELHERTPAGLRRFRPTGATIHFREDAVLMDGGARLTNEAQPSQRIFPVCRFPGLVHISQQELRASA